MSIPTTAYNSFTRYLAAKKSVDDRALSQPVWQALHAALQARTALRATPLRVVEIGGGIGTMIERAVARGLFSDADYTLVDAEAENIAQAQERVPAWAQAQGFAVTPLAGTTIHLAREATPAATRCQLTLHMRSADCFAFAARPDQQQRYDLLIAHAFLDLVDIPRALPQLQQLLQPEALLYLTINFDGNTILQPTLDPAFDRQIETLYHETMDTRLVNGQPSGDSQSGRHLFGHLRQAGIAIEAAGSSDWVVFGSPQGYPADEAYFLHFIVETMHGALRHHPALDQERYRAWIQARHEQIERGELVYIAHQLDFLGRQG